MKPLPAASAAAGATPDAPVASAHPGAENLASAATALGVGLPDSAAAQLLAYLALLQRWNKVYNLTALREPRQMYSHHLLDCLAVLPALDRVVGQTSGQHQGLAQAEPLPLRVLDVGSGGGLPGVVLAIMRPAWRVDCVDSVAKKAGFVRQVAAELGLTNLQGLHARVQQLTPPAAAPAQGLDAGYGLITSRAFASLADFVGLTQPLLAPTGLWAAMKARPEAEELAAVPPTAEVFHVEQLQVPGLDAQRCLVWMRPRAVATRPG